MKTQIPPSGPRVASNPGGGHRRPAAGHPGPRVPPHHAPFTSHMSDADLARLARNLDLATGMHPKLPNSPTSPGVARLDFWSGLFLLRGATEGNWVLECRTWGDPPPSLVHDWHVRAAFAARQLDPTVEPPPRRVTANRLDFAKSSERA